MKKTMLFAVTLLSCLNFVSAQDLVIPSGLCGDGVLDPGEACDPGQPDYGVDPDLGGAMCEGHGFNGGGDVSCTSKCTLDISACYCDVGTKFPATGQKGCWKGSSIDCAGTGQDGEIRAGAPLSYVDNGDGTITDENTGLVWESKNDAGGIHDKDNVYQWEASFTDFIDKLNDTCEGDGVVPCDSDDICGAAGQCGFAGFRDWRMPNIKELMSIVDYDVAVSVISQSPPVDPEFNSGCVGGCTACTCTVASFYWSSTSAVGPPPEGPGGGELPPGFSELGARAYQWGANGVDFFLFGWVYSASTDSEFYVRAVRGGDVP